jgi:ABC-type protease/lipase transport system fused ATPase/permease subunit
MTAKRCPMCLRTTHDSATECACGYAFGQDFAVVRDLVRRRLFTAKILCAALVIIAIPVVPCGLVLAIFVHPFIGMAVVVGTALSFCHVVRTIAVARASLRALASVRLPRAIAFE